MKIALIGRGRVATHLLKALLQAGHEVISVNSRTLEALPLVADIYILSVKDSALQDVIHNAVKGREGQLFVHTAGSMPLDLFKGCCTRYGVLYPMQTFSLDREVDFHEIPLFIEASDAASLEQIHALADSVSQHFDLLKRLAIGSLDEQRYFVEVHLTIQGECLHGIEHAVMRATALKKVQRHRASGMDEELPFPTLHSVADDVLQGTVLDAEDIDISRHRQFLQRATVDADHLVTCLKQSLQQVGGHATSSD